MPATPASLIQRTIELPVASFKPAPALLDMIEEAGKMLLQNGAGRRFGRFVCARCGRRMKRGAPRIIEAPATIRRVGSTEDADGTTVDATLRLTGDPVAICMRCTLAQKRRKPLVFRSGCGGIHGRQRPRRRQQLRRDNWYWPNYLERMWSNPFSLDMLWGPVSYFPPDRWL